MKEWFKARNIWGAAIMTLSDAEAGRFAKALWQYTMTGEAPEVTGNEKGVFAIALMTLGLDDQEGMTLSEKRAAAGSIGGKQKVANQIANVANEANVANATNKNKKEDKEEEKDIKETPSKEGAKKTAQRFTPPTEEEIAKYCIERENGVNPQRFFDFYSAKGWKIGNQTMKDWKAAVRTWEQRDDNRTPVKQVQAARYSQRQYTEKELEQLADDPVISILEGMA